MARISFTVDYTQAPSGVGQISLTVGNDAPKSADASGRLDKVGDMVFANFSRTMLANFVEIECTRTSSHTMRVVLRAGRFEDASAPEDYLFLERVIENVPLSFAP